MAAAYVGCAPSTITRTILRDPQFALEISQAEQSSEIQALQAIRKAYQEPRYWRAAAWLLERRNPNDFTVRKPNILTEEAAKDALDAFVKVAMEEVTDPKQYRRMMERVSEVLGLPPMDADELRDLNDIYSEEDTPAQPTTQKPFQDSRPNSSAMPDDDDASALQIGANLTLSYMTNPAIEKMAALRIHPNHVSFVAESRYTVMPLRLSTLARALAENYIAAYHHPSMAPVVLGDTLLLQKRDSPRDCR